MTLMETWQIKSALNEMVTFLYEADEHTGYRSGMDLRGINLKRKLNHWLLIVKVHDGQKSLCYFEKQSTYWRCIIAFGWNLKYGKIKWLDDKWP